MAALSHPHSRPLPRTCSDLARAAVANKIDEIVHVAGKGVHGAVAYRDVIACREAF